MKCERCNRPATVHVTEVQKGKRVERNLCEQCAAQSEGTPVKSPPINELLTKFVLAHSGLTKETNSACPHCGITWAEFRQTGLLGCENDYAVFDKDLTPLLQRAHDGGSHHVGKVPARRGGGAAAEVGEGTSAAKMQAELARLRKELARAVEAEDYEKAAKLRDQIREASGS